jgi:hypothetical protein
MEKELSYYIILYYIIFRVYTTSEDLINVSINKQKEERKKEIHRTPLTMKSI